MYTKAVQLDIIVLKIALLLYNLSVEMKEYFVLLEVLIHRKYYLF